MRASAERPRRGSAGYVLERSFNHRAHPARPGLAWSNRRRASGGQPDREEAWNALPPRLAGDDASSRWAAGRYPWAASVPPATFDPRDAVRREGGVFRAVGPQANDGDVVRCGRSVDQIQRRAPWPRRARRRRPGPARRSTRGSRPGVPERGMRAAPSACSGRCPSPRVRRWPRSPRSTNPPVPVTAIALAMSAPGARSVRVTPACPNPGRDVPVSVHAGRSRTAGSCRTRRSRQRRCRRSA